MICFNDIIRLLSVDLKNKYCIEILFSVKENTKYQHCWMGKMPDKSKEGKYVYWFGLVSDGSEAYDYDCLSDFISTPVFEGKSLKDVWDYVKVLEIDGCDPEWRLQNYLNME